MKFLTLAVLCLAMGIASAGVLGGVGLIPATAGAVIRGGNGAVIVGGGPLGLGLGGIGALGPLGLGAGLIGSGLEGQVGLIGSGIEGQYIPDINEHLYDDGSYRLEHHLSDE